GVGQALLRWFVAGVREVDLVAEGSVPESLAELWRTAESVHGAPVHLVDVTTDLGVPVYFAVAEGGGPTLAGAGAAPVGWYAAERAFAELVQAAAFPHGSVESVERHLGSWPALRDCATLPVERLLSGTVRYVDLRGGTVDTVPDAVDRLTVVLRGHGLGL